MAFTTVNKSSDYFNTKLYTGDGNQQNVTGVGFQPDWTWVKQRGAATDHSMQDAVRGAGKQIQSNDTSAETSNNNSLVGFVSDGFTVGFGTGDADAKVNASGGTYASWNWLANGSGSANTDGSISSTVSANTTSGFSIVSYTGNGTQPSTVGHGLGVTPQLVLVKPRSDAQSWCMYHESIGNTKVSYLDSSSASASSVLWNNTSPTSSSFTVNDNQVNSNTNTYIAYCFAEKQGYSKFGSYIGNGSADGSFIYTGFKPSFVMFKNTSSALFWQMHDSARDPFNEVQKRLAPNSSDAEGSGSVPIDFLSNGIKLRTTATTWNESGSNFIYMAFAEAPLVGTNNVPCTAR